MARYTAINLRQAQAWTTSWALFLVKFWKGGCDISASYSFHGRALGGSDDRWLGQGEEIFGNDGRLPISCIEGVGCYAADYTDSFVRCKGFWKVKEPVG